MRRSLLLLISSGIAAQNELPTPSSKSQAMLKSASFLKGYKQKMPNGGANRDQTAVFYQ